MVLPDFLNGPPQDLSSGTFRRGLPHESTVRGPRGMLRVP